MSLSEHLRLRGVGNLLRTAWLLGSAEWRVESAGRYFFGLPVYAHWDTEIWTGQDAFVEVVESGFLKVGIDYGSGFHGLMGPATVRLEKGSRLTIRGLVDLHRGTLIWASRGGRVSVGHRTYLANGSRVVCQERVEIGSGCAIAWDVTIQDCDMHELRGFGAAKPASGPVIVEDHVWIGAGAKVLKGVRVGTGAVVAANAVVTRDVEAGTIVAGNPARAIAKNMRWT